MSFIIVITSIKKNVCDNKFMENFAVDYSLVSAFGLFEANEPSGDEPPK